MRQQSLRVPWRQLADSCARLIEWRSFALWVRAILAAEKAMPAWLVAPVEQRCPGLLNPKKEQRDSEAMWLAISAWAEEHVFYAARDGGWIEALNFYSGRDSRSEAVWEAWDRAASGWQHSRPAVYPAFEEWHRQALAGMRADPQFTKLVHDYIEAEAFAFWVRAIAESDGEITAALSAAVDSRCPGLQLELDPEGERTDLGMTLWRKTLAWVEEHTFKAFDTPAQIEAIRGAARGHLRAERIAAYWAECGSSWTKRIPDRYPTFEEWLQQADAFVVST
jgi:hypothetical protein